LKELSTEEIMEILAEKMREDFKKDNEENKKE